MRRLALVLALALSACLTSNRHDQLELQASAERIRALEEDKKKLEAQNAEQQRKIEALIAQLTAANDELKRSKLQNQLDAAKAEVARLKKGGRPACNCAPSDPLCSCL